MQYSPRDLPNRTAGFTIIELLVGMAIAAIILAVSSQLLMSAAKVQAREEISVPVQESVRGAMEVMSTELREAMTPRVLSAYASPPGLNTYYSTNTVLSIIGGDAESTFAVAKPSGYPSTTGYPAQSRITVVTPNTAGKTCTSMLKAGDYFYLLSVTPGTTDTRATWGQVSLLGCAGSSLNTTVSMPQIGQWTVDSRILKASLTRYYTGTLSGVNVLYRQDLSGTSSGSPQVVAFDITELKLEYSSDGLTFTAVPSSTAEPLAIRITLTGQTNQQRLGTPANTLRPYTLSQVVFMRQTSLSKNF